MRGVLIGILAVVTLGTVVFVLIDMYAARAPSSAASAPVADGAPATDPTPPPTVVAPPPSPSVSPPALAPAPATPAPAAGTPVDPMDVVINGKTRREWHIYFAERQRAMAEEMARAQPIVDRAERGEEPDPRELGDAQTTLKQLRERIKQDIDALATIDAASP
ncbi:MAG: hypothetical protein JWN44_98 [Myxococcales bacterium]|nr:hypothetical protein [Myxococcales bacterium]